MPLDFSFFFKIGTFFAFCWQGKKGHFVAFSLLAINHFLRAIFFSIMVRAEKQEDDDVRTKIPNGISKRWWKVGLRSSSAKHLIRRCATSSSLCEVLMLNATTTNNHENRQALQLVFSIFIHSAKTRFDDCYFILIIAWHVCLLWLSPDRFALVVSQDILSSVWWPETHESLHRFFFAKPSCTASNILASLSWSRARGSCKTTAGSKNDEKL